MSDAIPIRSNATLKTIGRWLAFGGFGLVSIIFFLSYFVHTTINRLVPGSVPVQNVIGQMDYSTTPPALVETTVELIANQSIHLEDGILIYRADEPWIQRIFVGDTFLNQAPPPLVVVGDRTLSYSYRPSEILLTPRLSQISSNLGNAIELSIPIWYFAVPFVIGICVVSRLWFIGEIVRLKPTRIWQPLTYGLYPIILIFLVGLPAFLLTGTVIHTIGRFVGGDGYLDFVYSNEKVGLALFIGLIIGTPCLAVFVIHRFVMLSISRKNPAC